MLGEGRYSNTAREASALLPPAKPGAGRDGGHAFAMAMPDTQQHDAKHLQPGPEAA
jgi:hypothetical protein